MESDSDSSNDGENNLEARNYQIKLMEVALRKNTIIYLPTGSGKTFIAIMVMKQLCGELLDKSYGMGGKLCVMLVNTVTLVDQHTKYLRRFTPFNVGGYSGDMNVDYWSEQAWNEEFNKHQVLVMTSQILVNIIETSILSLNRIHLLIFDECHHAVNDHSMRQIMMKFENLQSPPRVLGLTATLLNKNCKPHQVVDEVRDLETTYHSTVATIDELKYVYGYSTNPVEMIRIFRAHEPSHIEKNVIKILVELQTLLYNIKEIGNIRSPPKGNLKYLNPDDTFNNVVKIIKDTVVHINELGIYGGKIGIISHLLHFERLRKNCQDAQFACIIDCVITNYILIQTIFEKAMEDLSPIDQIYQFSANQLIELFNILDEYRSKTKQDLCGIIFVQRRFTAKILYHIFHDLSQVDPRFQYLKPNFVVGYNSNPFTDTRESLYNAKMQKKVIAQFINKEINLLIASSVLEEGIDIPMCTLVVKFDKPADYRSYIQSKGRARHKKSFYGIMVSHTEQQAFFTKYRVFKEVENLLNEFLIGKTNKREGPLQKNIDEFYQESEFPPYHTNGPDSAAITMLSAIPLLCRYCSSLPSDKYTNYAPNWLLNDQGESSKYQVIVELPIISPILKPIEGPFMISKKLAKRAAALLACKLLHKRGELDDNLNPTPHDVVEEDVSHFFNHWPEANEANSSINKTKRVHSTKIPNVLIGKIKPLTCLYLHIIDFQPKVKYEELLTPGQKMMYQMYTNSRCFGLITSKKLPSLCEFSIYVSLGEIVVNFDVNKSIVRLNENEIYQLRIFHNLIFKDILKVLKSCLIFDNEENADGILVVPIQKTQCKIDFEVIRNHPSLIDINEEPSEKERSLTKVTNENYLGKIVSPWYRRDEQLYVVTDIPFHLNAYTEFPSNVFDNYANYFKEKYTLSVYSPDEPLLLVKSISRKMNCLKPRSNKKKDKEKNYEDMEEHLVAEFCIRQSFPACLWIQSYLIPSFLHRMFGLLQAYELLEKIAIEAGVGKLPDDHQWKTLVVDNYLEDGSDSDGNRKYEQKRLNTCVLEEVLAAVPNVALEKIKGDFITKKLDSEYPWEEKDEPVDIERNLNVTLMDIQYYDTFISKKVDIMTRKKRNHNQTRNNLPAIGFDRYFIEKQISLLQPLRTNAAPELADILQSLTTAKANDIVNFERMETLGDSFLKLAVSIFIVMKFPNYDEGKSTSLKCKLISNKNLYYIGVQKNLNGYIKVNEFIPNYEWKPPGYCLPKFITEKIETGNLDPGALMKISISKDEQILGIVDESTKTDILENLVDIEKKPEVTYDSSLAFINKRIISDKTIADSVEALIGTYFMSSGFEGGLKLMEWLKIIPKSENLVGIFNEEPPSPILNKDANLSNINFLFPSWKIVEEQLGYHFNNRAYLLQAFTHSSYTPNRITACYERLEFLGDAILDFLITCHIYETCDNLNPGQLTDLRSALVNNITFAGFTVRCGFHKFLLFYNNNLLNYIDNFVQYQESRNHIIDDEILILLQEDDLYLAEHIDVPKVLGDIFEALAGAVYLDSGMDLNTVWKVFYRIMWMEMETFKTNVPKNIVRMLHETPGSHPDFQAAVATTNGRVMVPLDFMLNGEKKRVFGFGENKVFAKKAASKIALRLLSSD